MSVNSIELLSIELKVMHEKEEFICLISILFCLIISFFKLKWVSKPISSEERNSISSWSWKATLGKIEYVDGQQKLGKTISYAMHAYPSVQWVEGFSIKVTRPTPYFFLKDFQADCGEKLGAPNVSAMKTVRFRSEYRIWSHYSGKGSEFFRTNSFQKKKKKFWRKKWKNSKFFFELIRNVLKDKPKMWAYGRMKNSIFTWQKYYYFPIELHWIPKLSECFNAMLLIQSQLFHSLWLAVNRSKKSFFSTEFISPHIPLPKKKSIKKGSSSFMRLISAPKSFEINTNISSSLDGKRCKLFLFRFSLDVKTCI